MLSNYAIVIVVIVMFCVYVIFEFLAILDCKRNNFFSNFPFLLILKYAREEAVPSAYPAMYGKRREAKKCLSA